MKNKLLVLLASGLLALTIASCTGPAGPIGTTGPAGPAGPIGNANVQQYTFGSRTIAAGGFASYTDMALTQTQLDNSTVLVYHARPSEPNNWYSTPGFGSDATYTVRAVLLSFLGNLQVNLVPRTADGSAALASSITFSRVRVIIIPNSSNVNLAATSGINLKDYNAVLKYFNLPQ